VADLPEDEIDASDEPDLTHEELKRKIAAKRARSAEAKMMPRSAKKRRAAEVKQRTTRVNPRLLRGESGEARDETWTIRARRSQIRAVKALAAELSEPGAKVSVAELMDEAMELLLSRYREQREGSDA
jgi:hypothetical protein